jgi:hypothetical protein
MDGAVEAILAAEKPNRIGVWGIAMLVLMFSSWNPVYTLDKHEA